MSTNTDAMDAMLEDLQCTGCDGAGSTVPLDSAPGAEPVPCDRCGGTGDRSGAAS